MDTFDLMIQGLQVALQPMNLLFCFLGFSWEHWWGSSRLGTDSSHCPAPAYKL